MAITADMAGVQLSRTIDNGSMMPSDWIMTIYGACVDPHVKIGDNVVELTGAIPAGAYARINSLAKTITLTTSDGTVSNIFDWGVRGKGVGSGHYVFEPIPAGSQPISWPSSFGFDLMLIERRGDPTWII